MSASGKISLSGLPRAELEALAERLLAENDALRQVVTELKAEVATLKGVKGRPEVKPSGMEKGAGSDPGATNRGRGGRGKAERLTVDEERVVEADVPAGSRFKGYEDFLVQDLVLRPHVVRVRRERWLIPTALVGDRFGPLAAGDRGEAVGHRHEPVPRLAAGRDDGLVVRPDPQAELVLAQVLPHVLDRVQLRAVARQGQEGEVLGDGQPPAGVPAGAVEHDHGVRARGDATADLRQVQAGGLGVGAGQHEGGADGPLGADRAEQVGPGVAAVARGRVPRRAQTRVSVPCWPTRASS